MLRRLKDPGNPIGLGEEGRVAHGKTHPNPEHLEPTHDITGLEQENAGHGVTQKDAGQQHVTQFPAGRLDHIGLAVADKDHDHHEGAHHPETREGDDADAPVRVCGEKLGRDGVAGRFVGMGQKAQRTVQALSLRGQILILGAILLGGRL